MEDREARARALCQEGKPDEATAEALRLYGREVLSFLVSLHREETAASDVFSDFSEELWKSMKTFRWQCSLRTFCYTIARRAAWRHRHDPKRRPERNVPLSQTSAVSKLANEVRSETAAYMRAESKSKLARIRETLTHEDSALLTLRVDKQLAWNEIATVMLEEKDGDAEDAEVVKRESARLRKRFEILKKKLLELGKQHGLVGPQSKDG
jgi:RNA polymerase sigma-70 factor (ECF subfamily)